MRGRDDRRAAGAREGRGRRARDVGLLGRRALRLLRLAPRQCGGGRGAEARESGLRDPPTVAAGSHWGGERTRELGPRLGSARTDGAGAGGKQGGRRGLWAAPGARSRGVPEHPLRASVPTPPPPRPLRVPQALPAQPSSFLSSAQQDTPSSDPGEPARASRGGGIFPNSDPAPGGPKLCGRERKGGWRAPGESREPQGAGPWPLPQGAALLSGGFDCGPRRRGRRTRVPAAEGGLCLGLGGQGRGRAMAEASGSQKMPKAESPTQPKVLLLPGERSRNGRRALRSPQ